MGEDFFTNDGESGNILSGGGNIAGGNTGGNFNGGTGGN